MADFPSSSEVADRRILIVGGAAGHGEYIARSFHAQGAEVVLLDASDTVRAVASSLQIRAESYVFDVRDHGAYAALADDIGSLDGFVYLPRIRLRKSFQDLTAADFDDEIQVSLRGAFLCAQAFAPRMRRERWPFIVNISSVLSHVIGSESVTYHVAKAGLDHLTRALAVELGPQGIRVNAVAPGLIVKDVHLDRFSSSQNERYRSVVEHAHALTGHGTSADVFEAVAFLASPRAKFITGQVLRVDGGVTLRESSSFLLAYDDVSVRTPGSSST